MVKIEDIAGAITQSMREYADSVEEEMEVAKDEVTKEGVSLLKKNSPVLTGSYRKGWSRKKFRNGIVVHNRTDYQLTHLLEHGHAKVNGGRVQGIPHIRPVEEQMVKDFEAKIERAIKR